MRLRLAFARLAIAATLVGHALAQAQDGGGTNNGGNNGNAGGNGNGNGNNAPVQSNSASASNSNGNAAPAGSSNRTSAAAPSATSLIAGNVVATTVTSLVAGPSGSTQTAVFTFTFTVGGQNNTANGPNSTLTNGTVDANATITNETALPWNDTLTYLPFTPKLDPAYGLGGALLILSGIPVATLGGKNRWSALAIVSGYTVALCSLVFILSFGVAPALEPPSPNPPSMAMRGLYLLAVGISCIVGGGLGIFFYTFAKYWVGAAGGFCLGWFLLALRKGGLVREVGPRWAILGSLTTAALVAAFIPKVHEYVLLVASALVGATAFTLGVDCFTRAGLKEFYIYNLGYSQLFPSLNGGKFPLTQSMQVEIGVIAAASLIAALIQFKVVNILQKRRKQIVEDEEARREAEEVARAAENFKNVDAELAEWEGKHGDGSRKGSSVLTPRNEPPSNLPGFDDGQAGNYSHSTLVGTPSTRKEQPPSDVPVNPRRMSLLEEMGYRDDDIPASPSPPTVLVANHDPDLEQKLQLLAEVRRARQGIKSSMDNLRSSATTPVFDGATGDAGSAGSQGSQSRPATVASIMDRGRGAVPSQPASLHSRANSTSSSHLLDGPRVRQDSNASSRLLDDRPRSRHLSATSSRLLDDDFYVRRESGAGRSLGGSFDERRAPRTFLPGDYSATELGNRLSLAESSSGPADAHHVDSGRDVRQRTSSNPDWEQRNAEWDAYLKTRNVQNPAPVVPVQSGEIAVVSGGVARAISQRVEGAAARPSERTPGQEYGANLMRALSMDMTRNANLPAPTQAPRAASGERTRTTPRAMTTEELAERHRDKLTRMQDRVSAPIREQIAVATAREEWTKAQAREREEQARRERTTERPPKHERGDTAKERSVGDVLTSRAPPRSSDRRRRTEEWRQSVPLSPQKAAAALPSASQLLPKSPPAGNASLPAARPQAARRASKANIA